MSHSPLYNCTIKACCMRTLIDVLTILIKSLDKMSAICYD